MVWVWVSKSGFERSLLHLPVCDEVEEKEGEGEGGRGVAGNQQQRQPAPEAEHGGCRGPRDLVVYGRADYFGGRAFAEAVIGRGRCT